MKHYLGVVYTPQLLDSDATAVELASQCSEKLAKMGGGIDVGKAYGDGPAILVLHLPDDVEQTPQDLVGGGVSFQQVHTEQVPVVEDQGITE